MENVRVLFFDVFGTCVAQEPSVAKEFERSAREALKDKSSFISSEIRAKTEEMSYDHWIELARQWNRESDDFVKNSIAEHDRVHWPAVDHHRIGRLPTLLAQRGLIFLEENTNGIAPQVQAGSLWNTSELEHLGRIWHRLSPWPDTCAGLKILNTRFTTVTLSNTYHALISELVTHGSMPFQQVYSSDLFESYKPNANVYLGAAAKIGIKPEECALVASHLSDLKGAKACGFYAIYVERPAEEKSPELRGENIPDLSISQDEEGFVALANHLGIP